MKPHALRTPAMRISRAVWTRSERWNDQRSDAGGGCKAGGSTGASCLDTCTVSLCFFHPVNEDMKTWIFSIHLYCTKWSGVPHHPSPSPDIPGAARHARARGQFAFSSETSGQGEVYLNSEQHCLSRSSSK